MAHFRDGPTRLTRTYEIVLIPHLGGAFTFIRHQEATDLALQTKNLGYPSLVCSLLYYTYYLVGQCLASQCTTGSEPNHIQPV